jgi:hypothetical protein
MKSCLTRTKAVSSRLYGDVAMAGEACPATALGITLHNNIVRWNAWSMVRGSSVFMDTLGTVGNKSTSACALKNIVGIVPETRNEGCRPSHGAATEHDECEVGPFIHLRVTHRRWLRHRGPLQASQPNHGHGSAAQVSPYPQIYRLISSKHAYRDTTPALDGERLQGGVHQRHRA